MTDHGGVGVRVLLLGGTAEARRLAGALDGRGQVRVVTSLAGRVREPVLPPGEVRIGGFGGQQGLVEWLRSRQVRAVVDATHPFAAVVSATAAGATARLGLPLVLLRRPGWQAGPGDDWHWVDSLDAAAARLPELGRRAFLTTGRTGLAAFARCERVWCLARVLEPGAAGQDCPARWTGGQVVCGRGPFTVQGELDLLRRHRIDVLVTKDSGGESTAAKLVAARRLGLPVLLVRRPPPPAGVPVLATETEVLHWLDRVIGDPASFDAHPW